LKQRIVQRLLDLYASDTERLDLCFLFLLEDEWSELLDPEEDEEEGEGVTYFRFFLCL
jgi:hypothetical protein